ncbi:MAG TPA: hypothetical protein VG077_19890 [Verrucomicrobiae bacterium]|nr:hypothetical protein [Verrucomicrobiae bacterium]
MVATKSTDFIESADGGHVFAHPLVLLSPLKNNIDTPGVGSALSDGLLNIFKQLAPRLCANGGVNCYSII